MSSVTLRATTLALAVIGLAACSSDPLNTANRRDGTPGNPPSTMTQRAADSVTGDRTPADGRPGNPPGTAVGRAAERTNERIGDPLNVDNRPDCTPGNPPGTAVSRALGTTDPADCRPAARRAHRGTHRAAASAPRRAVTPSSATGTTTTGTGATGPGGEPAFTTQGR
ncbi:hypothetical protein EAH89_11160 [Roseomonas nepalensis]|uniref:Uncharacterized protein n=1 Tax=Muricoccus nepalensis TaxID=1854500 RepID=A0A502G695_9PROT|nr:hypothetical protein [Roseomonas nepalensis]TPG57475.1 hypothetical protein EAH89_11160 [Roseomonas nepalensis]